MYHSYDDDHWSFTSDNDLHETELIDPEISFHHRESHHLKHVDWSDIPQFIYDTDPSMIDDGDALAQAYTYQYSWLPIRRSLNEDGLVLQPTYQGIDYCVYPLKRFQTKVQQLLAKSDTYTFIRQLNPSSAHIAQKYLAMTVDQVEMTLKRLYETKSMNYEQLSNLQIDRSTVRMPYLCFAVEMDAFEKELRPIMICTDGPTHRIAFYVGRLLNQLLRHNTPCRLFHQTTDLLDALKMYKNEDKLTSQTMFASLNIYEFCRHFSHDQIMIALEKFLDEYGSNEMLDGLTTQTILELVQLVLQHQYFIYNKKLYQQIAGGPSGSSLTIPLVYIALFYQYKDLFEKLTLNHEILGRFQDQAFITWNGSETELDQLLSNPTDSSSSKLTWELLDIEELFVFRDIVVWNSSGSFVTFYQGKFLVNDEKLPHYLDILQPSIHSSTTWLRKEFLKNIRYSSHPSLYYHVLQMIRATFLYHDGSETIFNQALSELLEKFSNFERKSKSDARHLKDLQREVMAFDQRRLKKKQAISNDTDTKQSLILPFASIWNRQAILEFENRLNYFFKKYLGKMSSDETLSIHIVPNRTSWTLLINDLLIKKRPDQRYLYLSYRQKTRPNLIDTIPLTTTMTDATVINDCSDQTN